MMGVAEAIGWGLLGSLLQGGIIALSVWLALKIVPPECAALRHRIALGGLVILLLAFIATEGLMLSDWRTHAACWSGAELPKGPAEAACASHGVPASGVPTGTVSADPAPSHRGVGKAKAVMATVPGPGIPRARGLEVLARAGRPR